MIAEQQQARELTVGWKVRINATLAARVELAMWDATRQKPKYGSRKQLIEALLRDWLSGGAVSHSEASDDDVSEGEL